MFPLTDPTGSWYKAKTMTRSELEGTSIGAPTDSPSAPGQGTLGCSCPFCDLWVYPTDEVRNPWAHRWCMVNCALDLLVGLDEEDEPF